VSDEERAFRDILEGLVRASSPGHALNALQRAGDYLREALDQLAAAAACRLAELDERSMEAAEAARETVTRALDLANQLHYLAIGREILPGRDSVTS
jgi:uncharacterized protein with von Willebrand factor type A (vWA) domain